MPQVTRTGVAAGVAFVLVGAMGFWAGRVALVSPENPLTAPAPLTYTVEEGQVGRSLTFTAIAHWELSPAGRNGAAGVVTSMPVTAGDEVSAGDVLYTVDLRPVVVAVGSVPAFRDMSLAAAGPDVAQLQELLVALGFLDVEPDGVFGRSTQSAVKAWQRSLGVKDDGVLGAGDVVFVPELPVRVAFADSLRVGARLSGGEEVVLTVPADPTFVIPLSPEQRSLVPLAAEVKVTYPEGVWEARVQEAVESPQMGRLDLVLGGADGGSVCGDDCAAWVGLLDQTDFRAQVVVIPDTVGPLVPISAIGTDAANEPYVTMVDGTRLPVTILAASQGTAVVDGVEPGTVVVLPYGSEPEGAGSG